MVSAPWCQVTGKRAADPTCTFEPVPCDFFITEATFGLPVFRHEPAGKEVKKLLGSQVRCSQSARTLSASTALANASA